MVNLDFVNTYTDIQQIVSKAADALLAIDKGMVVELCILGEDFGLLLVKGMQQHIMATLPAKEFRLTVEDSFSRMSAIKESKFTQVFTQLGVFLQVDIEGKNQHGSEAAQHLFQELNTKNADATVSPTLTDLDIIQKFQWLLNEKETKKLSGWVVNAISAAETLKRRRPTQSQGPSSGKKAKAGCPAASTPASSADSTAHIAQYFS